MLKGNFFIISCPLTNDRLISSEIVNAKVKKGFPRRDSFFCTENVEHHRNNSFFPKFRNAVNFFSICI